MGISRARDVRIPALLLVVGVGLTAAAVTATQASVRSARQAAFDDLASEVVAGIEGRVASATEVLHGLRGAFSLDPNLSRSEFNDLASRLALGRRVPSIRALSFIRPLVPADVPAYERAVRADRSVDPAGYPSFRVHPAGDNDDLFVVEYLEPLAGNEAALGLDLGSEPTRRAALQTARDSGDPIATGAIDLVQTGSRGFIVFLALYDHPEVPQTAPARRRSFFGLVNAVFDVEALLRSEFGADPLVDIEIYDGGSILEPVMPPSERDRMVGDRRLALDPGSAPEPNRSLDIAIADRRWRVFLSPRDTFTVGARSLPLAVGTAALALTLLAAFLVYSLGRARRLALAMAEDMTADLRRREGELANANAELAAAATDLGSMAERLREADRNKTIFLNSVSHELRTPLTAVEGFARLLRSPNIPDDQKADFTERIERNAAILGQLIDEMLDYARLERQAVAIDPEDVDIGELIAEVVASLSSMVATHRIETRVDGEVVARADAGALRRCLGNVLTNAVKFAPAGTLITVEASVQGEDVSLAVQDEGPGIPAGDRGVIFERFRRGSLAERLNIPGTGVGLSIVAELMELMDGRVLLDGDHPGPGARFILKLPRSDASVGGARARADVQSDEDG